MKQYLIFCAMAAAVIYLSISLALWTINPSQWKEYTKVGVVITILIAMFIGYILKQLDDNSKNS